MRECEELLKIVQRNKDSWLDLAGGLRLASHQNVAHVPSMPKVEELRQLLHYKTKVLGWLDRLLAAWTHDSTQSWCQVARTPCLRKTDFSHSFSPYYIYIYPYTHDFERAFQREFWERNPRKNQDWLFHNLYLRDSSNSSTLFFSIVKSLRGLLPKPFLTISISVRGLFDALGSS